ASAETITADNLSTVGSTLGTAAYMSPEQARGDSVDTRSDLFSFGLVLYEMLTGKQAFEGQSVVAVIDAILHREPPAPVRLNAAISPELEHVIRRSLEKDADLRYQSAAELGAELKGVLRTET